MSGFIEQVSRSVSLNMSDQDTVAPMLIIANGIFEFASLSSDSTFMKILLLM